MSLNPSGASTTICIYRYLVQTHCRRHLIEIQSSIDKLVLTSSTSGVERIQSPRHFTPPERARRWRVFGLFLLCSVRLLLLPRHRPDRQCRQLLYICTQRARRCRRNRCHRQAVKLPINSLRKDINYATLRSRSAAILKLAALCPLALNIMVYWISADDL